MSCVADDTKLNELREFIQTSLAKAEPRSQLIAVLHKAQELYGYLRQDTMDEISQSMQIPSSDIWGVATFYHYFNLKPRGKHTVSVCMGTACYVRGAQAVLDSIVQELGVGIGATSSDGVFSLTETRCLGTCGLAPVMMIDDKVYGELTSRKAVDVIRAIRSKEAKQPEK